MSTHPLCFVDADQYARWLQGASRSRDVGALRRSGYCVDCTPEFKQRMEQEERCEHPGVTFTSDNDGFICGVRETCGSHS